MGRETIATIKEKLFTKGCTQQELEMYQTDERKGVQKLVYQYEKQLAKKQALKDQFESMKEFEKYYTSQGKKLIAGVDEAGRGPIAGPVVAAAVILPESFYLEGLYDSKALSETQKDLFFDYIRTHSISYGVGIVSSETIDEINIYEATKLAMHRAIDALNPEPDQLLIDALPLTDTKAPVDAFPKGDQRSISIAAASVIAKVTRDRYMNELHQTFPSYEFSHNAGYGTKNHVEALRQYGITPHHRKSFAPVKEFVRSSQ
ncbi:MULTISPECIES: ribonuclease HII [Pontibacillus]|uniref:Ribonuclease HII n=1 Tax=Pontibacillus chungwhensis TaxID=265426 RepID=A0ABY8V513_9BACI|nr:MULTISPECIES: ribonuclease HII [Pontibacillus]MCD5322666.1 ribonuclease HII [Pontibacillus sp. HN14]WIF99944.1 ribonuclease HII [Pontibacillus chungwhensis]